MPASYRLRIHYLKGSTPFQNDIYYATGATDGTYAEALEIANGFVGAAAFNDLLTVVPSDVAVEAVSCASIVADGGSTVGSPTAIVATAGQFGLRVPATGTGQTSNADGPIITYIPDPLPGERARVCKLFIPTINESDAEDDQVSGPFQALLAGAIASLITSFTITSGPVIWAARITQLVGPTRVPIFRAIITAIAESFVATQRRRKPRHF